MPNSFAPAMKYMIARGLWDKLPEEDFNKLLKPKEKMTSEERGNLFLYSIKKTTSADIQSKDIDLCIAIESETPERAFEKEKSWDIPYLTGFKYALEYERKDQKNILIYGCYVQVGNELVKIHHYENPIPYSYDDTYFLYKNIPPASLKKKVSSAQPASPPPLFFSSVIQSASTSSSILQPSSPDQSPGNPAPASLERESSGSSCTFAISTPAVVISKASPIDETEEMLGIKNTPAPFRTKTAAIGFVGVLGDIAFVAGLSSLLIPLIPGVVSTLTSLAVVGAAIGTVFSLGLPILLPITVVGAIVTGVMLYALSRRPEPERNVESPDNNFSQSAGERGPQNPSAKKGFSPSPAASNGNANSEPPSLEIKNSNETGKKANGSNQYRLFPGYGFIWANKKPSSRSEQSSGSDLGENSVLQQPANETSLSRRN